MTLLLRAAALMVPSAKLAILLIPMVWILMKVSAWL